ncbi:MAG: hypothetical protein K0T99_02530 [Alphaproteobacteria bacterium]|nr:hypothetical protein [Alphaproteobacteria bacterium]
MQIISHRINRIEELSKVQFDHGIEIDIRSHGKDLILQHDPFYDYKNPPEKFETLLSEYIKTHKGIIILNIKTEGIEKECINLMNKYNYKDWFFLDLSMPYFVTYSNKAYLGTTEGLTPNNLAVRFSEFEPIEYALSFKNKVKWVWVDCFTQMPLNKKNYRQLKEAGFRICLVAPELQKHTNKTEEFQNIIKDNNIRLDAVCTKKAILWHKLDNHNL